jgi:hypothetical protein
MDFSFGSGGTAFGGYGGTSNENPVSAFGDNHDFVVLESSFPPLCQICKKVIKKPCCCPTTNCSAVFCFVCTSGRNSRCPTCNQGLQKVQISVKAEKQLNSFKGVCGFIGCNFAGTYQQVLAHIPRCKFGSFDSHPQSKVATCKRTTSSALTTVNQKVWQRRDCIVIESPYIPSCGLCKKVVYGPCHCTNLNCFSVFCTYCLPQRSAFGFRPTSTPCPECKSELPDQGQVSLEAHNELLDYKAKCKHCNYTDSFNNVSKHVEVCHECNEAAFICGSGNVTETENKACQKLKELIESARSRGVKFLNIQDSWSVDERLVFKTGVSKNEGRARHMYCEMTGFNAEWIKRATTQMLIQACRNLEIEMVLKTNVEGARYFNVDNELTREKLLDFLNGTITKPTSTGFGGFGLSTSITTNRSDIKGNISSGLFGSTPTRAHGGFTFGESTTDTRLSLSVSPSGKNTEQSSFSSSGFSFGDTNPFVKEALFSDYLRTEYILKGLKDMGFIKPSKIQEKVLKVTADRFAT